MSRETRKPLASNSIGRWPSPMFRLACEKCGRYGQYQTRNLIVRFGAEIELPWLIGKLVDCERKRRMNYYDPCKVTIVRDPNE